MNPDQAPIFSEGADLDQLSGDVASLLGDGKWVLSDDRKGIEKRYQFKGFKKAWVSPLSIPLPLVLACSNVRCQIFPLLA